MLEAIVNNQHFSVVNEDNHWLFNNKPIDFEIKLQPNGLLSILYNGKSITAIVEKVDRETKDLTLKIEGHNYTVQIKEPIDQLLNKMGINQKIQHKIESIKAPMPGLVLKVLVEVGQQINKGDGLIILEAMKMENILKAPSSAIVKSIKVTERTAVEKGTVLIELE